MYLTPAETLWVILLILALIGGILYRDEREERRRETMPQQTPAEQADFEPFPPIQGGGA